VPKAGAKPARCDPFAIGRNHDGQRIELIPLDKPDRFPVIDVAQLNIMIIAILLALNSDGEVLSIRRCVNGTDIAGPGGQ